MVYPKILNRFRKPPVKPVELPHHNGTSSPVSSNKLLVDLRQVVKTYDTPAGSFTALKNVDLQVEAGEFVAVIGKSGSGKSTLINMMTGIDRPTLGEVWVANIPIHTLNEDQLALWRGQSLGVIFQFFQLLPTLTLLENVMLPMQLSNTYARAERLERALHLLDLVDLADQAYKFPSAVSGGQQQRVAIARALANDPKVLVADEPTGSLDSKTADTIFQLFEDFVAQGRTILMVTHDRDLASRVSRVVLIADGEITDQYISKALFNLDQKELVQVSSKLEPVTYAPGAVIFRQGDPADKFYIIIKGQVEVVIQHPSGPEIVSATLGSGQFFGEMGLLQGGQRTATVRVYPQATAMLMALDRHTFSELMTDSKLTYEAIAGMMRQRATTGRLLAGLPQLTPDQLIDAQAERLTFQPGQAIIRQGEAGDKFYLITKGEVEVIRQRNGAEIILDRLTSGQYFGEVGLMHNKVRSATVRAASDLETEVEVVAMSGESFHKLSMTSAETRAEITSLIAERRQANTMVEASHPHD